MDDDFFRRDYETALHKRDNLFAWTVFILLLIGFALACWLGSFYIFGHPENPTSYRILKKLKKIEPPRRFEYTAAPTGEFLTPQKLYEKYATMPDYELHQENAQLLRDFIRNYQDTKKLVPYLVGSFRIISAAELTSRDLFSPGLVALAQASSYPQVLVENIYTANSSTVPQMRRILVPGLEIKLEKTIDLSAIIHIEKLDDGRLLLTAIPLLYSAYAMKQGAGSFSLEPPSEMRIEAGVPIIKPSALPLAGKVNVASITPAPSSVNPEPSTTVSTSSATPELVRVLPPIALSPTASAKHGSTPKPSAVAMASPTPKPPLSSHPSAPAITAASPSPLLVTSVTPPSNSVVSATRSPASAMPSITPEAILPSSTPPSVAVDHPSVPLQPFLEAKQTPVLTNGAGSWKLFHPGQMPRGRLVHVNETADMADHGLNGERFYLSGQFIVTASGENRAVLRSKGGLLNNLNPLDHSGGSSMRVVVEFPAGYQPPPEGSTFTRDAMRPFEIRDVQRVKDGTINVYVREVTLPD